MYHPGDKRAHWVRVLAAKPDGPSLITGARIAVGPTASHSDVPVPQGEHMHTFACVCTCVCTNNTDQVCLQKVSRECCHMLFKAASSFVL